MIDRQGWAGVFLPYLAKLDLLLNLKLIMITTEILKRPEGWLIWGDASSGFCAAKGHDGLNSAIF
jgi:hypothetical protein